MRGGDRSASGRRAAGAARGGTWLLAAAGLALVAARPASEAADRGIAELRVGLAVAGLALFAEGMRRQSRGIAEGPRAPRRLALGAVAALAFAANYNFFFWTGLHRHELYHYYLGSKYFPELGYFGLYTCSVEAAFGDAPLPAAITDITDLRTKRRRPAAEVMAAAPRCRDAFSSGRWTAFREDVDRFRALLGDARWGDVLRDHGYNPSPTWTALGRALSAWVPATPAGLWLLARIDLVLLLATFGGLGWAFGFEAMCVAAIVWGACGHTGYLWTGDAFLRQSWLAASILGLCAMRRGRPVASGALLAAASLERVFPAAFVLGYAAREACVWLREHRPTPELRRFAGGAVAAAIALAAAGTLVAGRGLAVWREFAENTRSMIAFTPMNALGLEYALRFTTSEPPDWRERSGTEAGREESIQAHKQRTLESRRGIQWAGLALFALLFGGAAWRGAGRERGGALRLASWEAIAMGAAAIPVLAMPGSYYLGFVVSGAALATRRPRIGVALLLATIGWAYCAARFEGRALGFAASSWILLGYSAWLLAELWRPSRHAGGPRL